MFGKNLKFYRQKANYSLEDLAYYSNLSIDSLFKYEEETEFPENIFIIKNLARVLNTTPACLLEYQDSDFYSVRNRHHQGANND